MKKIIKGSFELSEEEAKNDYGLAKHLETNKVYEFRELSENENQDKNLEKYPELENKNLLSCKKEGNLIFFEKCNGGTLKNLIYYIYKLNYGVDYMDYMNEIQIQNIIKQILNGLECLHKTRKMYNAISTYNIYINFDDEKQFELEDPKYREYYQKFKTNDDMKYTIKIKYFISEKERKRAIDPDKIDSFRPDIYYNENLKYYLAPEILEKLDVDDDNINTIAADMWSLGIITYELLVGKKFFSYKANKIIDILDTIKAGLIPFKDNLCPSLQIIQFITSLLKLDPKERPTFDNIKNHKFLSEDPVKFDFMDFSLFKKNEKNEIILDIKEREPIYVYLKNTKMENKIDQSVLDKIEEDRLEMEIQIKNKIIDRYKNDFRDCENIKDSQIRTTNAEEIKNQLEQLQKEKYILEQKLEKIKNNKNILI